MLENNPISLRARIKELFIDWLVISAYLVGLFAVTMAFYFLFFKGIPEFSETQSQLIATLTSVVPIVIIFSYLDLKGGSVGKRTSGLTIHFKNKNLASCLIRNIVKFLPWQLAHVGVIRGMYTEFDTVSTILVVASCLLLVVLFVMGTTRRDKRHLGDMLAGTQVQCNKN